MIQWLRRISFVSLILLSSCSRIPQRIDDLPLPDPVSLVAKVQKNSASLQDLSASGFVVFHSRLESRTVLGIKIKYLHPDYLSLTIKGILGLNLGTLTLRQDRLAVKSKISISQRHLGLTLTAESSGRCFRPLSK
jgi:cobyrinic acid a,c-diamide synthase